VEEGEASASGPKTRREGQKEEAWSNMAELIGYQLQGAKRSIFVGSDRNVRVVTRWCSWRRRRETRVVPWDHRRQGADGNRLQGVPSTSGQYRSGVVPPVRRDCMWQQYRGNI
jgi:hypothetical protein